MMRLSQAAQILGGRLLGADAEFIGVSTDSRGVARGQLFVALRGERLRRTRFHLAAAAKARRRRGPGR